MKLQSSAENQWMNEWIQNGQLEALSTVREQK